MCGVVGLITGILSSPDIEMFLNAVAVSRQRGTDGLGMTLLFENEPRLTFKTIPERGDLSWRNDMRGVLRRRLGMPAIAIANVRAEPTTEWVEKDAKTYCHPFEMNGWSVVHNGTIANDAELRDKYGAPLGVTIDSGVLPGLFSVGGVPDGLEEVVGSYGILATNGYGLWAATNYKPLYTARSRHDSLFLASLPEALDGVASVSLSPRALDQYTAYYIEVLDGYAATILEEPIAWKDLKRRALVVCSGGMDSTVAATAAVEEFGAENVTLLHFKYGCRSETQEIYAVSEVARRLGTSMEMLRVEDLFRAIAGTSPLLGTQAIRRDGDAGAEFAYEWVPARNLVFLSLATALAENGGYTHIVLGNNLEEAGAYPDNEPEFISRFNHLLPYAVADGQPVREVLQPVGNLMKHQIVKYGHELHAPLDVTWSCYEGVRVGDEVLHCGECGPCKMRRVAFKMNGLEDPILYAK